MKIKAPGAAVQGAKPELPAGQQDDGGLPLDDCGRLPIEFVPDAVSPSSPPFPHPSHVGTLCCAMQTLCSSICPLSGMGGSSLGLAQLPVAPDRGSPSRSSCTIPIY